MKRVLLFISTIIFISALVSCGNDDRGDGTGHMYDAALNGNPESLDPQSAVDPSSDTVIKNLYSGLMQIDGNGNVVCCNAESYTVSDDGLIYTFRLRNDNFWFFDDNNDDVIEEEEYFPVTAKDYAFALRRVLDPQMQSPYSEDFACIMGASEIISGKASVDSAEILAADDYTLMIVLERPNIEFLSLMASPAAYPCNEEFFYSTKGRYGLDDRSVMSNGAFYLRQWFYDPYGSNNILYMKRNDANWSESFDIFPSFLSFSIEDSEKDIQELFKQEKIECFTALNSTGFTSGKYLVDGYSAITLGLIFNPDDKIYSDKNMRKALAMSVNRDLFNNIPEDLQIAGGIIPPAMKCHGRSYRELVSDKQFILYDTEKAAECCNAAEKELKAENFDSVKILVNAETINSGYLSPLTQNWQELLGLNIGIEEVTADEFSRRIAEGDYSIALYPVKGETANVISFIREFERQPYFSGTILSENNISSPLTSCSTVTELVEAYTSAEKLITESCLFIPLFYKNMYLISDKDNEQIIYDPFSESIDYRLALNYD